MSETTWTVYRTHDSSVQESGMTLKDAAEKLITYDDYAFEVKDTGGYYELYIRSTDDLRYHGLVFCQGLGLCPTEDDLYRAIVGQIWGNYRAMPDAEFSEMIERLERENAEADDETTV